MIPDGVIEHFYMKNQTWQNDRSSQYRVQTSCLKGQGNFALGDLKLTGHQGNMQGH